VRFQLSIEVPDVDPEPVSVEAQLAVHDRERRAAETRAQVV